MSVERKFGLIIGSTYLLLLLVFTDDDIGNLSLVWYSPLVMLVLLMIFKPKLINPIRKFWLYIGHLLGIFNSTLLLSVIYFILISPISVLRKIFMPKKKHSDTTWLISSDGDKRNFYKQY